VIGIHGEFSMPPDYTDRLLNDGFTIGTVIRLSNISVDAISIIGDDHFSASIEYPYKGTKYAATIEFDIDLLNRLLFKSTKEIRDRVTKELIKDPITPRTLPFENPVKASVSTRLTKGFREKSNDPYIALKAVRIE
jgi:hypothetical protein